MIILLMGVSGAGKTTVGKSLAAALHCEFADADDYHSPANIEKMRNRIPLTDADREPWLETLRALIANWIASRKTAVLACSALKQTYRDQLRVSPEVRFIYLRVSPALLHERLRHRTGHFMTEAMLASQLATLEEPRDAVVVNGDSSPEEVTAEILRQIPAY
jgi:gluconokinase